MPRAHVRGAAVIAAAADSEPRDCRRRAGAVVTGDALTGAAGDAPDSPFPAAISADAKPALGRGFRLQWEPAQKAHVLLYPEGMVKLNGSAGEILKRCDGARTVAEIVSDLESAFSTTGLEKEVRAFMVFALEKQWLEIRG